MKLTEMTVTAFTELMASDAPAPGGGSAAALEGAQGAALAAMVCGLTLGKKKYVDYQDLAAQNQKKMEDLEHKFLVMIDKDTEAFNGVSAVFSMPKDTDEEKAARKEAMQKALKECTKTPYETMELCLESLETVKGLIGKTNDSAASDLGVSALSLKAAVQGAWLNVLINIGGINDEAFASDYRKKGEDILAKALPLADEIYETIKASL